MAFKMRSPLHNKPLTQGYGKVVEETGATKSPSTKQMKKSFQTGKTVGDAGPKSKTPTIDKFMQMHQRPSVSSNEPSYLDKVKTKAGMVGDLAIKAMDPFGIGQKLAGGFVGGLSSVINPSKSGPKSIITGPSKKDEQEQKRREEKKAESDAARKELPARQSFSYSKSASPMPIAKSNINQLNAPQSSFKGSPKVENTFEVKEEDGNVEIEDKMTDSNTGAQNDMDGDRLDAADKAIEKIDGSDSGSGNELYDYNPAMYARRKARKDKRNIRRREREERIVARNYGKDEAAKVRASNDKAIAETQTYKNPEMNDEVKDESGAVGSMTPNRAGRPANANLLMTAPVIMTDKHSMKGAVAKLKMKNIAQSE